MLPPTKERVFISYSHDSVEHTRRVRALADQLRADGVEAWIDQYVQDPEEGWIHWMRNQVKQASRVLLVFTETVENNALMIRVCSSHKLAANSYCFSFASMALLTRACNSCVRASMKESFCCLDLVASRLVNQARSSSTSDFWSSGDRRERSVR